MIIDLPSTTTSAVNRSLVDLRERGGTVALGRVLTMVIVTDESSAEEPIAAANAASFEHPCRVIVVGRGAKRGSPRMDAQIRVGGDAGASEAIVLRLYGELADHGASVVVPLLLPDAPVVAWWPTNAPDVPAEDPIGALAQRRITDAAHQRRPLAALERRLAGYRPGDTDLTWTRITNWRGLLAAALDQPPTETVTSAVVSGAPDSASTDLLAGWLALRLDCPVSRKRAGHAGTGMHSVTMNRASGPIVLSRPATSTATLQVPGQPARRLALPRRSLRDCIAEELRRLDADEVYAEVLRYGLPLLTKPGGNPASSKVAGASR
ncbi:MAG: glucose-6-phosphate dehydrogenase assembly protein OpcA [Actinobacteria bacterium 69-20]|nr:glucose-6-phosphate dehydrogenase assembly protein OpcA [Actinomycetota bacterium]OJV30307.1 MAG: glucose-6-phosphate dehydrogenase assembly protein OpcA [Actinobacteria bacterium 69-20]